jgi:hypothetical protein
MGAGGSLEVWYPLPGPLPAGTYRIAVSGFQDMGLTDARLHADLVLRHMGAADSIVVSADSAGFTDGDAGIYAASEIKAAVTGPAVPAAPGDLLVLIVKMVSGSSGFIEIGTNLTIP